MGRHTIPTKLKELAGNPGKRSLNKSEPKPTGRITQPKTLSPGAALLWKRLVNAMPAGLYASVDEGLLAEYCEAWSSSLSITATLVKDGLFSTGSMGQPVVHPGLKEKSNLARLMLQLSMKLGFDPVSRANLNSADDDEDDGFGIH